MVSFEDVETARKQLSILTEQYWLHHVLFSWQWWALLVLTIFPWVIWWKVVDKKRLLEILLYGFIIAVIATVLNLIGANLMLWSYPAQLFWFLIPPLLSIDLSIMPVEHMLVYQFFPTWTRFILALIVLAAVSSFVIEPLFVWGKIYGLYTWRHIYSFPIYILKAIFTKWIIESILSYQMKFTHNTTKKPF